MKHIFFILLFIPAILFCQSDELWIHRDEWKKWENSENEINLKPDWDKNLAIRKTSRQINQITGFLICYNGWYGTYTWVSIGGISSANTLLSVGISTRGIIHRIHIKNKCKKYFKKLK